MPYRIPLQSLIIPFIILIPLYFMKFNIFIHKYCLTLKNDFVIHNCKYTAFKLKIAQHKVK